MKDKILKWFMDGETGVSSEAMARAFASESQDPKRNEYHSHPSDPADFNRCLKLLHAVPEAKKHMDKVSGLSDIWEKLVDNWEKLEQCFLAEVGLDWSKGRELRATKTYAFMKDLGC